MSKIVDDAGSLRWKLSLSLITAYLLFHFPPYIIDSMRTVFCSLIYLHFLAQRGAVIKLYMMNAYQSLDARPY